MKDGNEGKEKSTYQSPRVKAISLRPEEAVLGHCKSPSSAGPVGASCVTGGACKTQGS